MGWTAGAALYRCFFFVLADGTADVPEAVAADRKATARRIWNLSRDDDFSPGDMYCNGSLIALGLATRETDDDGNATVNYAQYDDQENSGGDEDE